MNFIRNSEPVRFKAIGFYGEIANFHFIPVIQSF